MTKAGDKPLLAARATIRCCGRRSAIGLNESGEVLFIGHSADGAQRLANYEALGAEPCGCKQFADFWRDLVRGAAQSAVRHGFSAAAKAYEAAKAAPARKLLIKDPLADLPLLQRPEFLEPFMNRLLRDGCALSRDVRLTIKSRGDPWAYAFQLKGAASTLLSARISSSWVDDVFRKGLAVVESMLTLRTIPYKCGVARRGGFRVEQVVVEPSASGAFSIRLHRVNVAPSSDGAFLVATAGKGGRRRRGPKLPKDGQGRRP